MTRGASVLTPVDAAALDALAVPTARGTGAYEVAVGEDHLLGVHAGKLLIFGRAPDALTFVLGEREVAAARRAGVRGMQRGVLRGRGDVRPPT